MFLASLTPGTYQIIATKAGYISEGAAKEYFVEPRTEITVRKNDKPLKIPPLQLFKLSAIAGTVYDDANEPAVGLNVRLLKAQTVAGRERFESSPMGRENTWSATANDRGEYRITAVPPGKYVVAVFADRARSIASPAQFSLPAFYPDSNDIASALPLVVGVDEAVTNIDFHLGGAAGRTITGRVVDGPGGSTFVVRLIKATSGPITSEVELARVTTGPGGEFAFSNVADGSFTLSVVEWPRNADGSMMRFLSFARFSNALIIGRRPSSAGAAIPVEGLTTYWADWPLTIEKDISGLVVPLRTGRPICGRLVFEGLPASSDQPKVEDVDVWIVRADRSAVEIPVAAVRPDGTFCSIGLPDGKYHARVDGDLGRWRVRNVYQGGRIVNGEPIEAGEKIIFALSDRETRIDGNVRNAKGEAMPHASVLVFPAEQRLWTDSGPVPLLFRHTRTDVTGRFSLTDLVDGQYLLAALGSPARQDWTLTENLDRIVASATSVQISAGVARTVSLLSTELKVR